MCSPCLRVKTAGQPSTRRRGTGLWLSPANVVTACADAYSRVSRPRRRGSGRRADGPRRLHLTPNRGTSSAPETEAALAQSAGVTPMSGPIQAPAAPAPPACGAGAALLASMSTRDKLAQLLMVGVRNAADARAVVGNQHVGGIMIGSWTDLSMLTDGTIAGSPTWVRCHWRSASTRRAAGSRGFPR